MTFHSVRTYFLLTSQVFFLFFFMTFSRGLKEHFTVVNLHCLYNVYHWFVLFFNTHGVRRGRCHVIWVAVMGRALTTQSSDGNSGNGDMEGHLAGGERAWASAEVERYRLETVWALEPNSLREAGLSSTLELPTVGGSKLVWACL